MHWKQNVSQPAIHAFLKDLGIDISEGELSRLLVQTLSCFERERDEVRNAGLEIEQSTTRGNGLLGIYIHDIKDPRTGTSSKGEVPADFLVAKAPIFDWDARRFGDWVEAAAKKVGK